MKVWLDQGLLEEEQARLTVFDHGLTVGDGIFETLKVEGGKPFALTRHLQRLQVSARGLGLALDTERVRAAVEAVMGANEPLALGRLRITLTGGPSPLSSHRGEAPPTLIVALCASHPWEPAADVWVVPWTRNERAATVGLKTTSYADNVIALAHAHDRGASEAIFGNTQGQLCEGTGSNVFLAYQGQLVTPTLESGCLAGITRALVVEWLGEVVVRDVPLEALQTAEEAFLTSSTRDIQPIRAVNGRPLALVEGPLTRRALEVWRERSADLDP